MRRGTSRADSSSRPSAQRNAHGDDGGAAGDLAGGGEGDGRIGSEVGLRQDDGRRDACFAREGEEALDAPRAKVPVEGSCDEEKVDVRGEELSLVAPARRAADESRPARQDGVDDGEAVAGVGPRGDPVADGREVGRGVGREAQTAGELAGELAVRRREAVDLARCGQDASGDEPLVRVGFEQGFEVRIPPEAGQGHDGASVGKRSRTGRGEAGRVAKQTSPGASPVSITGALGGAPSRQARTVNRGCLRCR